LRSLWSLFASAGWMCGDVLLLRLIQVDPSLGGMFLVLTIEEQYDVTGLSTTCI
jgi:hypothetical protein